MARANQIYKLGPKASSFWDPRQSVKENQHLINYQVKELEKTEAVAAWIRSGGLEVATEEEFNAAAKREKDEQDSIASKSSNSPITDKDLADMLKGMKASDLQNKKLEAKHDALADEHAELVDDHAELQKNADGLAKENADLKAQLAAAQAASTGAGAGNGTIDGSGASDDQKKKGK